MEEKSVRGLRICTIRCGNNLPPLYYSKEEEKHITNSAPPQI